MTYDHDPPRLLDQPNDSPLRRLLQAGQRELPNAQQLHSLAAKLGPGPFEPPHGDGGAGGAPAAGAAGTATGPAILSAPIAKIAAVVVLGGAAALAGSSLITSQSPAPSAPPSVLSPSPSASVAAPIPVEPTSPPAPSEAPPIAVASPPTIPSVAPSIQPPTEVELLNKAQDALLANPAQAVAFAQEHAKTYPSGSLSQEREAIMIQALARMGRVAEARARTDQFAKTWPGSAHVRRLQTVVGLTQPADAGSDSNLGADTDLAR